jgi:RHS repeat-associated protein
MSGGVNNSRQTSITYPNGKVLNYNYNTGLDSNISRLSSLSDTSGTLESYSYLGLATVVKRSHSQLAIDLTYIKQSSESNGDAGDQYTGLDRFGRVVDQRWINTSTSTTTDRFQYGYDRDGNPLYRSNLVNTAFSELYHANGAGNGYNNLNELVAFARGTLNGTNDTISSPSHSITWSLDAEGNFSSTTTDGGSAVNNTFNKQNEETATGSSTLAFDKNGNLTTDDQGHTLVYDAWNRLVAVKNGSTTLVSYKYDGLGRRIVENPGTARDLYYSANWQVLEERYNGGSTADIQYIWSPVYVDALILRDRSTQHNGTLDERLWVQQDANWNVTALVNGSGSVVERYVYDPYGKVTYLTAAWATLSASAYAWIYLHQGSRYDSTSGVYDRRGRVYLPSLGRWAQVDPISFTAGDTDLYRYVGNAPTNALDPSGLFGLVQAFFAVRAAVRGENVVEGINNGNLNLVKGAGGVFVESGALAVDGIQRQAEIWTAGWYTPTYLSSTAQALAGAQRDANAGNYKAALQTLINLGKPPTVNLAEAAWAGNWDSFDQQLGALAWIFVPLLQTKGPIPRVMREPTLSELGSIMAEEERGLAGPGRFFDPVTGRIRPSTRGARPVSCFPAGTPVHTAVGLKAIEQIAPGDRVWAYDHWQLRWAEREVVEVYQYQHRGTMATLQVNGETIRATGGHPFWVVRGEELGNRPSPVRISAHQAGSRQAGRWVLARDLQPGDELLLRAGEVVPLESVQLDQMEEQVYNFHVAELQNYAVGGCGVLVHNTNDPAPPNPEQTAAIAKDLQKEIDAWRAAKEQAETAGRWGDGWHADTQIQILENEMRKLLGDPPKPWRGG